MRNLKGTLKDRQEGFTNQGAPRGGPGGGGGAGRRILADFVAHLFGDIAQTLGYRFTPPEALDASVQEADPAEQQVRTVPNRHDEDGGCDQQLSSSRGASDDITPLTSCRDATVKTNNEGS